MKNKTIETFYKKIKLKEAIDIESLPPPPITHVHVFHKEYPRLPSIQLTGDGINTSDELDFLLRNRYSERNFSDEPLSLNDLSKILYSVRVVDKKRKPERRTYPSGGARFPVEIYVVSFNVDGVEPGAYHYNILDYSLETLLKKDLRYKEAEIISPFLENTSAAIIMTSVLPRSEVKYGAKAYPFSLIEAGHIGQNIQLTCTKYKIACCSICGFVDDEISKILDLTEDEIPIYVIGLGKK